MTIVWLVVQYVAIIKQSGSMVGVPDALHCFVWWPLHMTVTCAALGSYLACPVPQDNTDWSLFRRLVYHKSFRRPSIVNGTITLSPWLGLALSFPAAILTHRDMQAAYHHLEVISSAAAGIEPGAEITPDTVRSLLASASQAWDMAARGKMWARLPWTYWLITQSILTLGVVVNTALLLRPLHRQIRDATISYQQDFMTLTEASADQTGESGQSDTTAIGDVIAKSALPPSDGTSEGQQLDHRSAAGIADEKSISFTHQTTTGSSGFARNSATAFNSPDADQIGDEEQGTVEKAAAHTDTKADRGSSRSLAARIRRNQPAGNTQAASNTEDGRLKQLKQTYRNLILFLGGSLIAAPGFIYVAASTSCCIYPAYLNGPDEAYRVVQATYLVNAWTTTWYALSTFTAIFLKYRDESVAPESGAGQTGRASIEARRSREHYHEVFRKQFVPGTT